MFTQQTLSTPLWFWISMYNVSIKYIVHSGLVEFEVDRIAITSSSGALFILRAPWLVSEWIYNDTSSFLRMLYGSHCLKHSIIHSPHSFLYDHSSRFAIKPEHESNSHNGEYTWCLDPVHTQRLNIPINKQLAGMSVYGNNKFPVMTYPIYAHRLVTVPQIQRMLFLTINASNANSFFLIDSLSYFMSLCIATNLRNRMENWNPKKQFNPLINTTMNGVI